MSLTFTDIFCGAGGEQLRAQRFPDSYIVLGNVGEQTMQAGNAVSANVAQWLGERVTAAMDGTR